MERQDFVFQANGVSLAGWIYRPADPPDRHPMIVMSHGLSGIIEMNLPHYAEAFAAAGFGCLVYDHRNYGRSAGWPRNETDPWQQVEDMREAVSVARNLPFADPERIGLWGTSYAGGHVLTVGALDRRLRCLVAQVPLVSGHRTFEHWVPAGKRDRFVDRLMQDRDDRAAGRPPAGTPAALPESETDAWVKASGAEAAYVNLVTLRSFDLLRGYEPISLIGRIAPMPLLMIIAEDDAQTPVEWQREAFDLAGEPKRLVSLPGGHYDAYDAQRGPATDAAVAWFREHLG